MHGLNEITAKIEIAFLPYKASMWDSMESVYLAASKDPEVHAVVVPIPYFEKDENGSLARKCYEIEEFPQNIPCTSYVDYDIKSVKPDIIYIHNPYDNFNYLTSVDPDFYSKELKKHCRRLVYIPYFCSNGGFSSALSFLYSYMWVNDIVVQSDAMRLCYNEIVDQSKFIITGSPKFDCVQEEHLEALELPLEWRTRKEGKQVIFFNTSLASLLGGSVKDYLRKIEYVFRQFQGREKYCLLWRPHPLLEETFQTLRSDYYSEYLRIKNFFLKDVAGIYDDTANISYAIACSDAYIGTESSSLVILFEAAKKPLFLFNEYIHSRPKELDEKGTLIHGRRDEWDDKYVITEGNNLFCLDEKGVFHFKCRLSENSMRMYGKVFEENHKLYICPLIPQEILVIDSDGSRRFIALRRHEEEYYAFHDAVRFGSFIFLLPMNYPFIVRLDLRTDRVSYIEIPNRFFWDLQNNEVIVGGYCIYQDFLMITSPSKSCVLAIHNESMEIQQFEFRELKDIGFTFIAPDPTGETLWLLPSHGFVVFCWNPSTGIILAFEDSMQEVSCYDFIHDKKIEDRPFSSMVFTEKGVLLAPFYGDRFRLLNLDDGSFQTWIPPFEIPKRPISDYYYSPFCGLIYRSSVVLDCELQTMGRIRYFSMFDRKLYEITDDLGDSIEIPICFEHSELIENCYGFSACSPWRRYGCYEDCFHTLEGFLDGNLPGKPFDIHAEIEDLEKIAVNTDGTCGQKTHEEVKRRFIQSIKGGSDDLA